MYAKTTLYLVQLKHFLGLSLQHSHQSILGWLVIKLFYLVTKFFLNDCFPGSWKDCLHLRGPADIPTLVKYRGDAA